MTPDSERTSTVAPPAPPVPPGGVAAAAPPAPEPSSRNGRNVGLILIGIGAVLLLAKIVPGMPVWALWPLIIVVVGVVKMLTPGAHGYGVERFFDGATTTAIGGILLGNTLGWVPWNVWWQVLALWPVLLITAGLSILGASLGHSWIKVLSGALVLAALGYAVLVSTPGYGLTPLTLGGSESFDLSQPVGNATTGSLNIATGASRITVSETSGTTVTFAGDSPFGEPRVESSVQGSSARVDFALAQGTPVVVGSTGARLDIKVPTRPEWDLEIDSGASTLDADLSALDVASVTLKTGVSTNTLRLGAPVRGDSELLVNSGVATIDVLVPRGVPVRIESAGGLVGRQIDRLFVRTDDGGWQNAEYAQAVGQGAPVWVIRNESGVGSFSVRTY